MKKVTTKTKKHSDKQTNRSSTPHFRRKKVKLFKTIPESTSRLSITVSRNLADRMKELARRHKQMRRMFIDGFYMEAFEQYIAEHEIPRRIIKVERRQVDIQFPTAGLELVNDLALIAYKQEKPVSAIIEEALRDYLSKPAHYLGQSWDESHPERYEQLNKG